TVIRSPPEARLRIANVKLDNSVSVLRSPLQGLKNKHVECSLQQLDSVLILASFVHRCRHSTRTGSRVSTPPSWRRLNSKPCFIVPLTSVNKSKKRRPADAGLSIH